MPSDAYTFDKNGMRRAVDSIRHTEQDRQLRRGLRDVPTIPVHRGLRMAVIDSATPTATVDTNGDPVQWDYEITEVEKTGAGYAVSAWSSIEGGYSGPAFHMAEAVNSASDPQGNGVDHSGADYPEGFTMQPLPVGLPVPVTTVQVTEEGESPVLEYWILPIPNGEDGTCEAEE